MPTAPWMLPPALLLSLIVVRTLAGLFQGRKLLRVEIPAWLGAAFGGGFGLWVSSFWMRGIASGAIECIELRGSVCRLPYYAVSEQPGLFWMTAGFAWILGTALVAFGLSELRRWRDAVPQTGRV